MISIKDYKKTSAFFSLLLWLKSKETIDNVNIDNVNNHTKENGFVINMVSHTLLAILPDEFKSIVQGSVDQEIYQDVLSANRNL